MNDCGVEKEYNSGEQEILYRVIQLSAAVKYIGTVKVIIEGCAYYSCCDVRNYGYIIDIPKTENPCEKVEECEID